MNRDGFSEAVEKKTPHALIIFIVAISILATVALAAIWTGFISPDSWEYLRLASSFFDGNACSVKGEYFAVFPCGYPALVAGLSWVSGLDLFTSSKVLNIALLGASGFFVYSATKNIFLSFLFIVNPIALAIGHYTWSENLFLLSFSMIYFSLTKINSGERGAKVALPLLIGLLAGVSSRYFFGPYALLIFITSWAVHGRGTALKVLPYFALAGAAFAGYYLYNKIETGYGTGMPRIPSPESFTLLTMSFGFYILEDSAIYISSLLPALALSMLWALKKRSLSTISDNPSKNNLNEKKYKNYIFLTALGIVYLLLAFLMRVYAQYDIYGYRTVGYGLMFILSSLASLALASISSKISAKHVWALAATGILSLALSQRDFYFGFLSDNREETYNHSFKAAIDDYSGKLEIDGVLVPFNVPPPKWSVSPNTDIFYGKNVVVDNPRTAPYLKRENADEFRRRLSNHGANCFLDFTRIKNTEELKILLGATYAVDVDLQNGLLNPRIVRDNRFDESLSNYLIKVFSPGAMVACNSHG